MLVTFTKFLLVFLIVSLLAKILITFGLNSLVPQDWIQSLVKNLSSCVSDISQAILAFSAVGAFLIFEESLKYSRHEKILLDKFKENPDITRNGLKIVKSFFIMN